MRNVFALIGVSLLCIGCGDFEARRPAASEPKKTVAEEFKIDCSQTAQDERQRLMKEAGEIGLFSKYESDGAMVVCWTGAHWGTTPFKTKEQFVSLIFAYTCCSAPNDDFPMVMVRDHLNGKNVATFTKGRGFVVK